MNALFYLAAAVAVLCTVLAITRLNAMHALLYLIVMLLAVALVFFLLGATFVAALEVVIYAGAIMVLFVFAIMMLNLGPHSAAEESQLLNWKAWLGPVVLALVLLAELAYMLVWSGEPAGTPAAVGPQQVGAALFGPYLLGVELASMVLLAGLVGAYHLGRRVPRQDQVQGGS